MTLIVKDTNSLRSYIEILDFFNGDLSILRDLIKHIPKAIKTILKEIEPKNIDKDLELKIYTLFEKFDEAYTEVVTKEEQKEVSIPVQNNKAGIFFEEVMKLRMLDILIFDMSLVYLITKFENFLRMLLRLTFLKEPRILMTKGKSINYEEVLRFSNYNKLLLNIIEKEMFSLFMENIENINKYFEQRFNIALSSFVDEWLKFKERFYRRNLIVHNNSVINETYIEKTGYKGEDRILRVDPKYLDESIELFGEFSKKITEHFREKFEE